MAIDTDRKRGSALRFGQVWSGVLPVPSGTVDQLARQTVLVMYGGILAGAVVVPPTIDYGHPGGLIDNDLERRRRLEDEELLVTVALFMVASRNIR